MKAYRYKITTQNNERHVITVISLNTTTARIALINQFGEKSTFIYDGYSDLILHPQP